MPSFNELEIMEFFSSFIFKFDYISNGDDFNNNFDPPIHRFVRDLAVKLIHSQELLGLKNRPLMIQSLLGQLKLHKFTQSVSSELDFLRKKRTKLIYFYSSLIINLFSLIHGRCFSLFNLQSCSLIYLSLSFLSWLNKTE